jgi:glycine oxidase
VKTSSLSFLLYPLSFHHTLMNSDVLIIGGGVIGLSIARALHSRGVRSITIVDRGNLGGEASWAAAGMLAPNIEATLPDGFHKFCTESLALYPGLATALLDDTGIDIELDRTGTIYLALTEADVSELRKHTGTRLSADEISSMEPFISADVREGIFFPNDWQVENRKLLDALRRSAELNDIHIFEQTEVSGLITDGSRVVGARTSNGDLTADRTVVATGAWTSLIQIGDAAMPFTVKPIRGQMASFECKERPLRHVVFSLRGYLVPRSDGRVAVGATVEDVGFDKNTTVEGIDSLRNAAVEIAPGLAKFPLTAQWAGLRPFTADGLPIIGNLPGYENVMVATAHYRNGILLAPRTAEIVADKIVDDVDSEFFGLFRADRFSSTAANRG